MPTYGGYSPSPERYQGGRRRLQDIHETLLAFCADEIALNVDFGSVTWIEEFAMALQIDAAWGTNERGSNEFDPLRTQSMLTRWEAIFSLAVRDTLTETQRRNRLLFAWQAFAKSATRAQMTADLSYLGGEAFVAVQTNQYGLGTFYSVYPGGPFPSIYGDLVDWWSSLYHFGVQVARPPGMVPTEYRDRCADMNGYLDGALPAWWTFGLFQYRDDATPGFYFDEPNLDLSPIYG